MKSLHNQNATIFRNNNCFLNSHRLVGVSELICSVLQKYLFCKNICFAKIFVLQKYLLAKIFVLQKYLFCKDICFAKISVLKKLNREVSSLKLFTMTIY